MIGTIRKVGNDLLFNAINHHNIADVSALLEDSEANVNCTNINGQTPLHYAVDAQNTQIIQLLLEFGASPDTQEHQEVGKNTPLHMAVERNMLDVVDLFLQCGADPTIPNVHGFTCLHVAARVGLLDMTKLLLARGVNPQIRDKYGNSPAYWAKEKRHADVLEVLPDPLKISMQEYCEHTKIVFEQHVGGPIGGKKKKKGKKGGKKKK